ncbi:MAG: right-handed parallel beta-helix repeat-containing protein [bacterium]
MTYRDCIFRDLDAGNSTGGGLAGNGNVDVIDCEFVNCFANSGGGLIHSGGHLNLIRSTFENCGNSGAYLLGVSGGEGESALVEDCLFLDNWSNAGGPGLTIYRYDQGAIVRRCRFEGNHASAYAGGALSFTGYGPKLIEDCPFLNNSIDGGTGRGGALVVQDNGTCEIRGNTFFGNHQTYQSGGGSAVFIYAPGVLFERNVVVQSTGVPAFHVQAGSSVSTSCNIFWDNPEGIGIPLSPTDREMDPLFCDPENHDFTVRENSPCVEPGSLGCGQIGAFGAGCGIVSVEASSWSRIKSSYRNGERP